MLNRLSWVRPAGSQESRRAFTEKSWAEGGRGYSRWEGSRRSEDDKGGAVWVATVPLGSRQWGRGHWWPTFPIAPHPSYFIYNNYPAVQLNLYYTWWLFIFDMHQNKLSQLRMVYVWTDQTNIPLVDCIVQSDVAVFSPFCAPGIFCDPPTAVAFLTHSHHLYAVVQFVAPAAVAQHSSSVELPVKVDTVNRHRHWPHLEHAF